MDFRDFVEAASKVVPIMDRLDREYGCLDRSEIPELSDEELGNLFFAKTWVSGGSTGGGYWGQDSVRSVEADKPEDITPDVSKVLIAVGKENISFVGYMATIQPIVQTADLTGSVDYYGNYHSYSRVYVNLKELYDVVYGD